MDLVCGSRTSDDNVLLTMAERKSSEFLIVPLKDNTAATINDAVKKVMDIFSEHINEVFKTITADNGSEFAELSKLEENTGTKVYYTHPFTSCEKGTVERHNRLIRRFIPKGHRIDEYSPEAIGYMELWCSTLPRKILNYQTPDEIFEEELDRIYAL